MNVVHNDTNDEIILGLKLEYNGAHKCYVCGVTWMFQVAAVAIFIEHFRKSLKDLLLIGLKRVDSLLQSLHALIHAVALIPLWNVRISSLPYDGLIK
jgi:hypothetical protein